jgi:wobble nucleotide-excising tRNase
LFDSVATPATMTLARMTLVYAENGRGKTTLSAILRSLATGVAVPILERRRLGAANPPHIVIDSDGGPPPCTFQNGAWNRSVPNMAVFDDSFVDENICSGLLVEAGHRQRLHEFILGARGVALNTALQQAVDEVEAHNRTLRGKADAIPAGARGDLNVDDFCALPAAANIDQGIQDAERNLQAAKEQTSIRTAEGFDPFLLPEIDSDGISEVLSAELSDLNSEAAARVQNHLQQIGGGGEEWVASGMDRVQRHSLESCPFCAQDLSASTIIEHYRAYFGEAYGSLKDLIAGTIREFARSHGTGEPGDVDSQAAFERAIRIAVERRQFWSRFTDIPEIAIDTAKVAQARSLAQRAILSALRAKQASPLERMALDENAQKALAAYEAVRQEVEALNGSLQGANRAIALVREQAAAGNVAVLQRDVTRLKATKARHSAEVAPACQEYLTEKAAKTAAEQRRDAARAALDQYRTDIFPTYQTAINEYLRRFNAGFRLTQVTAQNTRGGSACVYSVLINNQAVAIGANPAPGVPSFRSSLSAGDRNTLALAFFFAALDQDQALADKIVVIDDPVSSLDEHRSLTTTQELRRLMQRAGQVIVLSHNKPFLCGLWDATDDSPRVALEVVRDNNGSTIRSWDVNQDLVTLHDRRHEILRAYVTTAAGVDAREVAEAIRPVLEKFCRVSYPDAYPPGQLLGPFRGICQQRVGAANQILDRDDIDELHALTEYANLFHHDTNAAFRTQNINDAELLDFVQRTLAFARR